MTNLLFFKGNAVYFNSITVSLFSAGFLIYGFIRAHEFVKFYKTKLFLTFALHYYALILNGIHSLVLHHKVYNATVWTELCMLVFMVLFFILTMVLTYCFYLKHLYSMITTEHFKTVSRLFLPLAFWKRLNRDYYDYGSLHNENSEEGEEEDFSPDFNREEDYMNINGWFRYMNYQILGNYLFAQIFILFSLAFTYFVRIVSIQHDLIPNTQLSIISAGLLMFCLVICYFDLNYRMFTKSLILPHLALLQLLGSWMLEHYRDYDKRPEPISLLTFILIFMYIVVKFAFLSDVHQFETMKKRL